MKNKQIGQVGEDIACKFLMKRGFKVIERNYLKKCGEIDVVVKKDGMTHFVEVKTVTRENFNILPNDYQGSYRPEDNLHFYKISRLKRVIQVYLVERYIKNDWKFHVVTVLYNPVLKRAKVEFLEDLIL